MTGEPISLQEWLERATPNHPLALIRDEARSLVEESVEPWLPRFEDDDPIVYSADEDPE